MLDGSGAELLACGAGGLGLPSELLAYGLFMRLLGLVYCVSFSSLGVQILSIAGSEGLSPALQVAAQLSVDFPSALHRFWYFPSLFHILPPSDGALRGVCAAGFASGLAMIYGGTAGVVAVPLAWVAMLSLAEVADLNYPWDCLLLEAGFLALLLPGTAALPALGAAAPPAASVAWALRWLLFRVLFGFGKLKFVGTSPKDSCYIKSFLIGMPIPTRSAWYVYTPLTPRQATDSLPPRYFLPPGQLPPAVGVLRWLLSFPLYSRMPSVLTGNPRTHALVHMPICARLSLDPGVCVRTLLAGLHTGHRCHSTRSRCSVRRI